MPVVSGIILMRIIANPTMTEKIYYYLSLPPLILGGLYFFFTHCIWVLRCDEDSKTLIFTRVFRKKVIPIKEIEELIIYRTLRGYDYRFKTSRYSITFEEMDEMPELIAFLKKNNPQINIGSPEDHTYF